MKQRLSGDILDWIQQVDRPVLLSEVLAQFGNTRKVRAAFDLLIKETAPLRAVFPEAVPGDSGRQFWHWRWLTEVKP